MLSLPATKGFEIGSGFAASTMKGSEHNDPFEIREGEGPHDEQSLRRRAGRDQQRREHRLSRRLQTDGHDCAPSRKRSPRRRRRPLSPRAAATIPVCCRGRCRWLKRWRRSSSAITRCDNARLRQRVNDMTAGSSLWQMIFVSFALVLILFEVVRGWRLGVVRQAVRLLRLSAPMRPRSSADACFSRLCVPSCASPISSFRSSPAQSSLSWFTR